MQWFCAQHRLAKNYADARLPTTAAKPAGPLAEHAEAIRALGKRAIADVVEIGRHLIKAKDLCGHGNWSSWLDTEFGWKESTALRLMHVSNLAGKSVNLADLNLPISTLYLLAAPSTPQQAIASVAERSSRGERLTTADVKQAVAEAKHQDIPLAPAQFEPIQQDLLDQTMKIIREMNAPTLDRLAIAVRKIQDRRVICF